MFRNVTRALKSFELSIFLFLFFLFFIDLNHVLQNVAVFQVFQKVEFVNQAQTGFFLKYQSIHIRSMQYKYSFLHKVFYKWIMSIHSYLIICVLTAKETWSKRKTWDTLLSQKWFAQAEILLSLQKQPVKPSE